MPHGGTTCDENRDQDILERLGYVHAKDWIEALSKEGRRYQWSTDHVEMIDLDMRCTT
jgi:hypothetical protein